MGAKSTVLSLNKAYQILISLNKSDQLGILQSLQFFTDFTEFPFYVSTVETVFSCS